MILAYRSKIPRQSDASPVLEYKPDELRKSRNFLPGSTHSRGCCRREEEASPFDSLNLQHLWILIGDE